jgi:DNA-binding response OmpR family regulator
MAESQKILVVDDEEHVVAAIVTNLELEGFDVVPAYSGSEALELVAEEKPDLIVLDVMMPEMSGWEVLQSLKDNPDTETVPVVMLTALSQDRDIEMGWELEANAYLTKPFDPAKLIRIVREQFALLEG